MRRYSFQKLVAIGTLTNIDFLIDHLVGLIGNIYRQFEICIWDMFELRVDQGLIKI